MITLYRYDYDNSGAIDKGEMYCVLKSIYAMVMGDSKGTSKLSTSSLAVAHAEKLFRIIDLDGDGNLTEGEFLRVGFCQFFQSLFQGCLNDHVLLANLSKIIDSCQPPTAYQSSYF